jgi:hypothetical protein
MGNGSVIRPGDVQRMSAGTGVVHAEYNASSTEPVHFLQIWILPERRGLPSGYEQKFFGVEGKRGTLRLIASRDGADGSVRIQQDARVFASLLEDGATVRHTIARGRKGWLHIVAGTAAVNGQSVKEGDGIAIDASDSDETLEITAAAGGEGGEVLLFDMTGQV